MSKFQTWLSTNKVLIFGILSAVAMNIEQYFNSTAGYSWQVIALSSGVVIVSFLAKNLRGQWVTILGSVQTLLTVILNDVDTHTPILWRTVIITFVVAILAAVAPAGKSLSYEKSGPVEAAKAEAKVMDAAQKPPVNPPVETNTPQKP